MLGIDAGFTGMGLCVVDTADTRNSPYGNPLWTIHHHTGRSPERDSVTSDDANRIRGITDQILVAYRLFVPQEAIVELPVGGAKSASAIKGMAFATSITVVTLHLLGLKVTEITPARNKLASTGNPKGEKEAVILAVKQAWPTVRWPQMKKKKCEDQPGCEAIADALSTILAWWQLNPAWRTGQQPPHLVQTRG